MKHLALVVFLILWLGGIAAVGATAGRVPRNVATHFAASGKPDRWMSRSKHLALMLTLATVVPAFVAGIFAATRRLPSSLINLPNKDYWLAEERRAQTDAWMTKAGLWYGAVMAAFFITLHFLVLEANRVIPPHLGKGVWILVGAMVAAILGLIAAIFVKFGKKHP